MQLCRSHNLSAEALANKWESFTLQQSNIESEMTEESLRQFKAILSARMLQQGAKKTTGRKVEVLKRESLGSLYMLLNDFNQCLVSTSSCINLPSQPTQLPPRKTKRIVMVNR